LSGKPKSWLAKTRRNDGIALIFKKIV